MRDSACRVEMSSQPLQSTAHGLGILGTAFLSPSFSWISKAPTWQNSMNFPQVTHFS